LTISETYDRKGRPKPDVLKQHFLGEGRLQEDLALQIVADASAVLGKEKNLLDVEAPVTGILLSVTESHVN